MKGKRWFWREYGLQTLEWVALGLVILSLVAAVAFWLTYQASELTGRTVTETIEALFECAQRLDFDCAREVWQPEVGKARKEPEGLRDGWWCITHLSDCWREVIEPPIERGTQWVWDWLEQWDTWLEGILANLLAAIAVILGIAIIRWLPSRRRGAKPTPPVPVPQPVPTPPPYRPTDGPTSTPGPSLTHIATPTLTPTAQAPAPTGAQWTPNPPSPPPLTPGEQIGLVVTGGAIVIGFTFAELTLAILGVAAAHAGAPGIAFDILIIAPMELFLVDTEVAIIVSIYRSISTGEKQPVILLPPWGLER